MLSCQGQLSAALEREQALSVDLQASTAHLQKERRVKKEEKENGKVF